MINDCLTMSSHLGVQLAYLYLGLLLLLLLLLFSLWSFLL